MKKILSALLCLTMVLGSILMLASCGEKPKLNLEKAQDNLEDEDYVVRYSDDEDELDVGVSEHLYAFNGEDFITIIKCQKSSTAKLLYEQLKYENDASIKQCEMRIKYLEHLLSDYEDELKKSEIEKYEDELEEYEEQLEDLKEEKDYTCGKSGKYVWYGSPDALKDTK